MAGGSNTGEPTGGLPVVLLEGPLHGKIIPSQTVCSFIGEREKKRDRQTDKTDRYIYIVYIILYREREQSRR